MEQQRFVEDGEAGDVSTQLGHIMAQAPHAPYRSK
jgi:hypothetical protein